jgi:hypothetical protein
VASLFRLDGVRGIALYSAYLMLKSFYRRVGDIYESSDLTIGPWSNEHQHAGPPAALLAREIEPLAGDMQVVRITYELMRPVPVASLRLESRELRPGRSVRLFGASLWAGETELVRATALCIRSKSIDYQPPAAIAPQEKIPKVQDSAPAEFPFFQSEVGYHTAMELRIGRGGIGQGFAAAWLRMRHPLVEGEVPSQLQRVAIAADSGNGVSSALDWQRYLFINPDLTIYIHRLPAGEWIGLDAHTTAEPTGVGIADDQLHDERGPIGRAVQSLFIDQA